MQLRGSWTDLEIACLQCSIIEPSRVLSYLRRRERRMEEGYRDEYAERRQRGV
jgi:hypothetical protein